MFTEHETINPVGLRVVSTGKPVPATTGCKKSFANLRNRKKFFFFLMSMDSKKSRLTTILKKALK